MRDLRIDRRVALAGALTTFAAPVLARFSATPSTPGPGAAIGWAAFDMGSGRSWGVDRALRLPMCSTFKWLLSACVLSRIDAGRERLNRRIAFGRADLLDYAPTTRGVLIAAGGDQAAMTVAALCEAALVLSDNTAANLLLPTVGGPTGLTAWLRAQGDPTTRLDRTEPALNDVPVGDPRDTTTPDEMLRHLRRILFGRVLSPDSRARLLAWMLACRTAPDRLAAGLPQGWRIAHRTGTRSVDPKEDKRERSAAGDLGVLLPPKGAPILIAAYTAGSRRPQAEIDRWFADLARSVLAAASTSR